MSIILSFDLVQYLISPPVREQTRDSVELKVFLSQSHIAELDKNPNMRVMVYCTADSGLKQFTKSDIAFPHQVELKANLDEVKANLRGLKNKPGTTQPADVTSYLRKKLNYPNNIVMTYALTQKVKFSYDLRQSRRSTNNIEEIPWLTLSRNSSY